MTEAAPNDFRPTLLVLMKYPAAGQVKTRLAQSLGAEEAAEVYREWIGITLRKMQPLRPAVRVVSYFDGAAVEQFAPWHSLADAWWPQPAGDLGSRLTAGFLRAETRASEASPSRVAAIGTDCLEIDGPRVQEAFERLATCDAVFGPAHDGGYYLVGRSRELPGFFDGIPWSSASTLQEHLAHCNRNGWSVALMRRLSDIDTLDDWQRYLQRTGRRQNSVP